MFTRKRTQGRDFYDIAFLLNKTKPNYGFLKSRLGIDTPVLLKDKLLAKCSGLDFKKLGKDIENLIFNPNDIKKVVLFEDLIKEVDL